MKTILSLVISATTCLLLSGSAAAIGIGDAAPAFSRADLAGKPVRLADYRGKIVLINFWATWCAPCRKEMPLFSKWQGDYGAKGLQIFGVSIDEDAATVKTMLAQRPVTYPILMGDAKLSEDYGGVVALPVSILVDAQGRIVARYEGESDLVKMEAKIKELLLRQGK